MYISSPNKGASLNSEIFTHIHIMGLMVISSRVFTNLSAVFINSSSVYLYGMTVRLKDRKETGHGVLVNLHNLFLFLIPIMQTCSLLIRKSLNKRKCINA